MGLEPTTTGLKVLRSTDWANRVEVHGVGFEPTSTYTVDLKSTPLDHSGIQANEELVLEGFEPSTFGS